MSKVKRFFKKNSHNNLFKELAGFGRALNRLYENRNYDLYSNGEFTVLNKIARLNPKVVIDGGANIGGYSLLINKLMPTTKVYAFEPVKSTFAKLKENVSPYPTIIPIEKGFYKETCTKEINIFSSDTHSSIYDYQGHSNESNPKQTIELVSGDDFMKKTNIPEIDFLKIDVEGAEYDALLGFEKHIDQGKIKAIQFEYGYINITTKQLLIDFHAFFESKGYVLGKIFPKTVEFRKYKLKHEDFIGPNFIAVKSTEIALIELLKRK
ncbi:MAG: FkbM family methyltransferase [Sphingobacteriales bacterium]|jgi:FkbM family methyltransferase